MDFPEGTLCQREVAAYVVARALGWPSVPATVLRDGPFGIGSVQRFVSADPEEHYFTLLEDHEAAFRLVAAFDLVVNNADRKAGHCLLGEDGRIHVVDHGVCFSDEPKLRTVIWDFIEAAGRRADPHRRAAARGRAPRGLGSERSSPSCCPPPSSTPWSNAPGPSPRWSASPTPVRIGGRSLAADLMLVRATIDTPLGPFTAIVGGTGVVRTRFDEDDGPVAPSSEDDVTEDRRRTAPIRREVEAYFADGSARSRPPRTCRSSATASPARPGDGPDDPVRRAVDHGDVAAAAGTARAGRAAGSALARCPIELFVPCHRVVRAGPSLRRTAGTRAATLPPRGWRERSPTNRRPRRWWNG